MDSFLIDPFAFCKNGERIGGHTPVSGLERLAAVCASQAGELSWEVAGFLDHRQKPRLLIHVSGNMPLVCQRCLEVLVCKLDSETVVAVARTEEEADEMEESFEDGEAVEVIVTDAKVDVRDLVEDEALLALPLSPRHEACPDTSAGKWQEKRESPFSALKALKTKG